MNGSLCLGPEDAEWLRYEAGDRVSCMCWPMRRVDRERCGDDEHDGRGRNAARGHGGPARGRATGALAVDCHHLSRQPGTAEPDRTEGRRAPGVLRVDGLAHDVA